jgi:hypothetical protein
MDRQIGTQSDDSKTTTFFETLDKLLLEWIEGEKKPPKLLEGKLGHLVVLKRRIPMKSLEYGTGSSSSAGSLPLLLESVADRLARVVARTFKLLEKDNKDASLTSELVQYRELLLTVAHLLMCQHPDNESIQHHRKLSYGERASGNTHLTYT